MSTVPSRRRLPQSFWPNRDQTARSFQTSAGQGWEYDKAKDNLSADPGWANISYSGTVEFLRIDLGSSHSVCRLGYLPRVLGPVEDGSWNGAYKQYEVYVTDNGKGSRAHIRIVFKASLLR
jgi:hypothetical protein